MKEKIDDHLPDTLQDCISDLMDLINSSLGKIDCKSPDSVVVIHNLNNAIEILKDMKDAVWTCPHLRRE